MTYQRSYSARVGCVLERWGSSFSLLPPNRACVLDCGGCGAAFFCVGAARFSRVSQTYLRLFKAIQSYLRGFQKKNLFEMCSCLPSIIRHQRICFCPALAVGKGSVPLCGIPVAVFCVPPNTPSHSPPTPLLQNNAACVLDCGCCNAAFHCLLASVVRFDRDASHACAAARPPPFLRRRLIKPFKTYTSLIKHFFKNPFLCVAPILASEAPNSDFRPANLCQPLPATPGGWFIGSLGFGASLELGCWNLSVPFRKPLEACGRGGEGGQGGTASASTPQPEAYVKLCQPPRGGDCCPRLPLFPLHIL